MEIHPYSTISLLLHLQIQIIVGRGDWLGKLANIKVENVAVFYVGNCLTVQNPLFFVYKLTE